MTGQIDSGALPAALMWLQALLLGSLAQALATIAFASLGFAALQSDVSLTAAFRVTVGTFIILGAPSLAAGITGIASHSPPPPAAIYVPQPPAMATQAARDAQRQQSQARYGPAHPCRCSNPLPSIPFPI